MAAVPRIYTHVEGATHMDDGHLVLAVRPGAHDNRVHIDRAVNMFARPSHPRAVPEECGAGRRGDNVLHEE